MTRRRWVYPSDGSPPYEVDLTRKPPRLHVLHLTEAIGADGHVIPKPELRRLNAEGKALHLEEMRNIAQDAHHETLRQTEIDRGRRKAALADAINGRGL